MSRRWLALVAGVWLGTTLSASAQQGIPITRLPDRLPEPNRLPPSSPPSPITTAPLDQTITRVLQESGRLRQYRIYVSVQGNVVDLKGEVADESQRQIVLELLHKVPGSFTVRDWLQVRQDSSLVPAQLVPAQALLPAPQPQPAPLPPPLPVPPPAVQGQQKGPDRIDGQQQIQEPMPIFQAPQGPNPTIMPPPMPPYAWPTFAPYNNFSRVAYPTAYPYEQWPFIGPFYPFPRIPLGWRSVTLSWDDGHWWLFRSPTGHDWWRVRYH
jgi:hypothetical protein